MISAPRPPNEALRLQELYSYNIVDTEAEQSFDDLTRLACDICDSPIALISFVTPNRQWFKSAAGIDVCETSREFAFCAHAILQHDIFEIEDALLDARFFDNPLVSGAPNIRFYAGAPLISPAGFAVGTLCTIGMQPKKLSDKQRRALKTLSNEVISQLELRKKVAELNAINQYKTTFLANMSHEIRTPMNGIMGLTSLILDSQLTPTQQQHATAIEESSNTLLDVLDDILDFSNIEAGKIKLNNSEVQLTSLLNEVKQSFESSVRKYDVPLQIHAQHNTSVTAITDPARLKQVLQKLLSNALVFTPQGHIQLNYELEHDDQQVWLKFSIIDNDLVLSQHQQKAILDRFDYNSHQINRDYGGSGLGLAVCKQLISIMGGEIGINSDEQQSTCTWFKIPYQQEKLEKIALPSKDKAVNNHFNGSVLVVEDNRINQMVAKGLLEKLGLSVDIAEHGQIAIEALEKKSYELVFMDCQMPVLNGYAATQYIRSTESSYQNIPIIAMTASAMEDDKQRCLTIGMNDFLSKPVSMESMRQALQQWL